MLALGIGQPQGPGQGGEDLCRRAGRPALLQPGDVVGRHPPPADPGRFEWTLPGLAYPSSKAAPNMLTAQCAKAFPAIRINAVDPGYTATDLNGHRGTQTVEQGAVIIVRIATITPDGLTGCYFDAVGPVPW